MSHSDNSALILPLSSVHVILAALRGSTIDVPTTANRLHHWLDGELARAVRNARQRPLKKDDVGQLARTYWSFAHVVDSLQDRHDPPPPVPLDEGYTPWERWLNAQSCSMERGRPRNKNWTLIANILALYEAISGRVASGEQSNGPTMRFLRTALRELTAHAPNELRSYFATPQARTLKDRLPEMRKSTMMKSKSLLKVIIADDAG